MTDYIVVIISVLAAIILVQWFAIYILFKRVGYNDERIKCNADTICRKYEHVRDLIFTTKDRVMERIDPFLSTPEEEEEFAATLRAMVEEYNSIEGPVYEPDPYLISVNEYYLQKGCECNEKHELIYNQRLNRVEYFLDHTNCVVVENPEEVIGDALKFFGVRSGNSDVVYVRNNNYNADFRIKRVSGIDA